MPSTSNITQILHLIRATCPRPRPSTWAALTRRNASSATRTRLRPSPAPLSPSRAAPARAPAQRLRPRDRSSMANDDEYMAFLNKANKDADEARASAPATAQSLQQQNPPPFKALDAGLQVPKVILDAIGGDAVYVSDADEPFHGVCLKWSGEGGLPDEETFARLIEHWDAPNAEVEIMDPAEWDRHEQYGDIVDAVSQATKGNDVRVYRVPRDKTTRVEYWVVSRDDATGSLVGVKALGVES